MLRLTAVLSLTLMLLAGMVPPAQAGDAETIAAVIARAARTGKKTGDGIVTISPLSSVLNIHEVAPAAGGGA